MSLLRIALVLGVAAYFIPLDDQASVEKAQENAVSPFEAIGAAQATFSDVTQFCSRNDAVCETGRDVATIVALKAQAGARLVANYFDDAEGAMSTSDTKIETIALDQPDFASIDQVETSSIGRSDTDQIPVPRPRPL